MNLSLNKLIGQRLDIQYGKTERHTPDWLFILWMGGTALLSYSLVYALRKPFTAAEFEGLTVAGMDYKIVVSIIQLIGYVCAKLFGIKYISELQPQNRLKFIIGSAALSEASLLAFGLLPLPYNIVALFFNGLSLGCMWGVIFSFLEGRRTTDILASIMGVSMALSSGVGSTNMDFRSFEHNFEANAFFYDKETAMTLKEIFLHFLTVENVVAVVIR